MASLSLTNLDPYAKRLTALANKAGAGFPTAKITAKTWEATLDKALDVLEAPVAAPAVITEPAPAPVPEPASAYGPRIPPAFNMAEDAGRLGITIIDHSAMYCVIRSSLTLPAGVHNAGYTFYIDGVGTVFTAPDAYFVSTRKEAIIKMGANGGGSPRIVLTNPLVTHLQPFEISQQSALSIVAGSAVIRGGDFRDTTGPSINNVSPDPLGLEVYNSRFGVVGKNGYRDINNPGNNLHAESAFLGGKRNIIHDCRFDWSDWAPGDGIQPATLSGPVFAQNWVPGMGRILVDIRRTQMIGLAGLPMHYTLTLDGRDASQGMDAFVIDNVIEKGPSAYASVGGAVSLTKSGNTDPSGVNIDGLIG